MGKMSKDRPDWDYYFMFQAALAATRSSCMYIDAGAVVVKDERVLATGYNGAPPGNKSCLVRGCNKDLEGISQELKGSGTCRGTHAEMNALQYAGKDANGSTLYTLILPCSHCAKQAASAKVKKVVYALEYVTSGKSEGDLTRAIFAEAGIALEQVKIVEDYQKQHERMLRVINDNFRAHKKA